LEKTLTDVRRKDRQETDPSFLTEILHNSASCTIAIEKAGFPLNHVAFFVFDESQNELIFHFSKHGYAGEQIIDGKKACVSIHKYGKLYTAKRAVDFGCEYQSIIIYGTIRILSDDQERMDAMSLFFKKFFSTIPEDQYEAFTIQDAKPIHVARIRIENWVGKQHLVPQFALSSFYPPYAPVI
jgi:nitroimidazol reductase NimA-like FMN-containing flavoprotein (pyridoxamine 5'-phosphate oxidase superfamily)